MKKKVLLLSNAYWPSIGGIENSLRHLANEAKESGDDVSIIVSDIGVKNNDPERFESVVDGVKVTRYPLAPLSGFLKPLNLIVSQWKLYKILQQRYKVAPETVVVARYHFCALMAVFAGFSDVRYLVPSIISHQSECEKDREKPLLTKFKLFLFISLHNVVQRSALKRCQNFVFSNTMLKQSLALAGNRPYDYRLTKPGVDPQRFNVATESERSELRKQLLLPRDKPIALFVGRFVKAKGVDVLLKAMNYVNMDMHIVLVGDGDEKEAYLQYIDRHNLNDKVSVVEPTREVEAYFRCADIFVMSSRYEPLGQTLLEAFASGLLIVAFDRCEYVDTATSELGMDRSVIYAQKFDATALGIALEKAFAMVGEFNRLDSSEIALKKFSWSNLYSELTENAHHI
ncbi:glycosyltransferase family 1 protein [Corallincola luteus]|uniref:Glycosyltransferase family 1 protein n=1 Tax=Corallincola luteus TaxID=1775177 RepID=A0ABY2AQG7_9GAMM|nr:glycosyltransferase family 4 protein [Corallincola luteus]TCI05430.1 glycosyltransferase family 1 protein [Corallincola luteus]